DIDGVANLVLGSQRHDLGQVSVVAPVRPMKGLFARDPWEQRDVDAVPNQSHIDIVAADRQQAESQLHHLRGTRAVDDRCGDRFFATVQALYGFHLMSSGRIDLKTASPEPSGLPVCYNRNLSSVIGSSCTRFPVAW